MQHLPDKNHSLKGTQRTPSIAIDTAEYPEGIYKAIKRFSGGGQKIACKKHVINVDFKRPLNLILYGSQLKQ